MQVSKCVQETGFEGKIFGWQFTLPQIGTLKTKIIKKSVARMLNKVSNCDKCVCKFLTLDLIELDSNAVRMKNEE